MPDAPVPKITSEPVPVAHEHGFYDRTAKIELAVAITADAFDNAQTCHNLANGGREDWLPTQRCAPATLMLTAQLAGQELVAYVLHRTHHQAGARGEAVQHRGEHAGNHLAGSVHSWSGTATDPRIDLGPYSEEIRAWLRGESGFPKYTYLIIVVSPPLRAQMELTGHFEQLMVETVQKSRKTQAYLKARAKAARERKGRKS